MELSTDKTSNRVERQALFQPQFEDVVKALSKGLRENFETVNVSLEDCPDLTQEPFHLAAKGLGGSPKIVDLGGPPYLLPNVDKSRYYDCALLGEICQIEPAFIVGAGAGPFQYVGTNSEVIKVHVKKRTGSKDFVTSMREALKSQFGDKAVGLGGAFLVKEGKVRQHVMSDFSKTPIHTEEELNSWLNFYEMSAPLVALGILISVDPGMDLRVQHFHSFSLHGEGGHYHYDTTPDSVEYLAYLNMAGELIRIDRPEVTHQFGRD
ncbi:ester hydrolase C11orf54 homolog isoform X2 [Nilaparvata lugens]|uniref:ester hydrolase C11orf54 homolog isoform X2 n=1 Tax=Nilaparvata lugens TaxID=108931 RepID=UPI00193E5C18|nr:ester hydrolase C11orf54 homolog isoform X2 [Nilaparvata lugens]